MEEVLDNDLPREEGEEGLELKEEQLQVFGMTLAATRDKWIAARQASGWDSQLAKDLDAYHMRDAATKGAASMMDNVRSGGPQPSGQAATTRSTVYVGISRQKTNAAEARLADILLPTDDRNWGIQPTPDPEGMLAKSEDGLLVDPGTGQPVLLDPDGAVTADPEIGKPVKKSEVAIAAERAARGAAEAMQREIDDQLVECDYLGELRKMIHFAAVTGTGVIKGPMVVSRTRRAWRERKEVDPATGQVKTIRVQEVVEDIRPASVSVDPAMVWEDPDCGDNVQHGQGIFELQRLTEKRVRELVKQPAYMRDQVLTALELGPTRSDKTLYEQNRPNSGRSSTEFKLFDHWIYSGELRREDLEAAGIDVPEDELDVVSGCVEMINDTVVRAYLNPLESGELPYDFFPWEKVSGSPRGLGPPYLMRAEQSVTNAGWRQLMDNSGVSTGPQIVMNRKAVTPADGRTELRPNKFWYVNDETLDVGKVFAAVEFSNHQAELQGIIEMAAKLGDQSSGVPMLATGERGTAPDTVGGMELLMNSANVVLRRLVKQFDDLVTKPHIRRYYDYNMAYSSKDEIKGDFSVDARGSSALLVRDVQNQAIVQLLASGANPFYAPMLNRKKLFEMGLKAQHLKPSDIILPEDEIKANMEAEANRQDPRIAAAQINAEARMKQADAVAQGRAVETEVLREAEAESRRIRYLQLQMEHELEIMKMAQAKDMSIESIKAQLAGTAMQERTRKELAASKAMYDDKASDRVLGEPKEASLKDKS